MADKRDDEKEKETFKVTDRRMFTPEGERRTDIEPEPRPEKTPPKSETSAPPKTAEHPAGVQTAQERPEPHSPASFEHLVMSLATTAMFQMGLVRSPGNENPPVDLTAAKETLDLLDVLQQKTKGNLTKNEEEILTGSLYELRMVFVETAQKGRGR